MRNRVSRFFGNILEAADSFFDLSPLIPQRETKPSIKLGRMESVETIKPKMVKPVSFRPQVPMRIIDIQWEVESTSDWLIHDIQCGMESQFAAHGPPTPLSKLWGPYRFHTLQTAMDFIIYVEYVGEKEDGERFAANIKGEVP